MAKLRRRSLQASLPFAVCAILAAAFAITLWLASRVLQTALVESVEDRVDATAAVLSQLFVEGSAASMRAVEALSARVELSSYLLQPDDVTRQALFPLLVAAAEESRAESLELLDGAGRCVLTVARIDTISAGPFVVADV